MSTGPSDVCTNQYTFNKAIKNAIKYDKEQTCVDPVYMAVYVILYFVLMVWSICLAIKIEQKERWEHIIFAVLCPPVYIAAYYAGHFTD